MQGLWTFALLLSATARATSAVLQLQGDDFQAYLETHSPVLVNFCLPWYEPCQNLEAEFETVAEVLKKRDITCISVNCSVENNTCISNQITSYPTIRIFRGLKTFTRYRHERKAPNIISYMIRNDLSLITEITSENIKEILSMGTSALIAYVDQDDDESRSIFTSFAESHHNEFIYGITTDVTHAKSDAQEAPFMMLYNPLDQVNPIFQGPFEVSKLEAFARKYSSPLIGSFSLETYYTYTESGLPLLHIFTSSISEHAPLLSLLKPVAEKYKGKLDFATIDATKYGFFAKALNLVSEKFPAFVIEDTISGDAVPFDGEEEVTGEKIEGYIERYFERREKGNVPMQTVGSNRDEL